VIQGRVIDKASFSAPRLRRHGALFSGQRVSRVETRGKAMLTHFDHGWSIYSHNQLYGVWYTAVRGELPATSRSLRLALHTETHSALLYSASDISIWRSEELAEHPFLVKLGPDILDPGLAWRDIAARLRLPQFASKSLATLYLDQGFIAGIGNYLRAEILFQAGLQPNLTPAQLRRGQLGALARSTLEVSWRSYRTGGITVPSRLAARLKREGRGYEKRRFMVFGRAGRPCRSCGTKIRRLEANSRRLYLCPTCQPGS
jgi:endonuclease-8